MTRLLHATCVALEGRGVLLRAAPGGGKSDLALRLIDRGGLLVADDQVRLDLEEGRLIARAPATIAGRMEVRGVGIVEVPWAESAPVAALFDLVPGEAVPRLPERQEEALEGGVLVPVWRIDPFEPSAPLKIALLCETALRAPPPAT